MKSLRNAAVTALLTIGAFSTIAYTSCEKDECADVICMNNGTCVDGACVCPTGYEGTTCQTESRTKFIKVWNAADQVNSTNLVYTCSIGSGTTVTSVIISNDFSDDFFLSPVQATVDGNTITIPDQRPDGSVSDYRVQGTGTVSGGKINWTYKITKISTSSVQNYTGVWQ